jgi:hypothetical protein
MGVDARSQFGADLTDIPMGARRHPRFRLEVGIRVYPRGAAVVRGDTVDISESGTSAMLREEVPAVGEVVRLEFTLPLGDVELSHWSGNETRSDTAFSSWRKDPRTTSSDGPAASWRWSSRFWRAKRSDLSDCFPAELRSV